MKILPILNFDSLDEFLTEFIEDISDEDAYTSATVVCDIDMSLNLLRKLFEIDKKFYPEFIDINTVDYDGYYYLSITSDLTVSCVAVEHNGTCYKNESDYTYIQDSVPQRMMKYFGNEWKVIFGIDE